MKIRFVFLGLVILFIVLTVNSCKEDDRITLNKTSLFLENGGAYTEDTVTLIAITSYSNKKVIWKSSNPNIVTVTPDGLVTAISKGEAIITASVQNRKQTATCSVTVADYREKWVGNWDLTVKESEGNGGVIRRDTIYYLGKIILGSVYNELIINYKEHTSMTVKVSKSGRIFNSDAEGFLGNIIFHLRFFRSSGMHGINTWSLDIDGLKEESKKRIDNNK